MMTMVISGSDGVTFPDSTNQFSGGAFSFKNRILNGDMRIDQRNAGASVSVDGAAPYTLDRWQPVDSSDGAFSVQRDTVVPPGFVNSLKVTTTTADASLSASQFANLLYKIEGNNVADLGWGTASAKTVTLSFWVRSSLTGTFAGSIRNDAGARSYVFNYTISSADTWEYKTITIAGDTSGTWETGISTGLLLTWSFGAGSNFDATAGSWLAGSFFNTSGAVSVIGTLNATWYITGVQLEVGSVATPFERRPYGTELALCQRYCQVSGGEQSTQTVMVGVSNGTTVSTQSLKPYVKFRTLPTLSLSAVSDFGWLQFSPFVTNTPSSASINFTLSLPTNTGTIITQNSTPAFASTIGVGGATAAASGAGITFPATQSASSDANTLDDYEEGTWTPVDGSGAALSFTLEGTASYVKIGRVCTATCFVIYPSTANGTNASIGGFPFTIANIGNLQGASVGNTDYGTGITVLGLGNNTRVAFTTFADVNITNANLSTKFIRISFTYITT
jgi:hypothetical protein